MTDKKTDLDSLSEEVQRLRFTLDHVGAYVFTKDTCGRYTFANDMVCELFGQNLDSIIGSTDEAFFDLSISDELRQNDLRVLRHGERIENEERNIIAETGEERFYWTVKVPIHDHQHQIIGLCGISTDITERRCLEKELAEQKNLLSLVLENMDAFVYMKDKQRRYLYVNEKVTQLYGRPIEEIVGQKEEELLPKAVAEKFAEMDDTVFRTGQKITGEEVVHGLDGEVSHYWSIKMPLFKNGQIDGLIGISTDITEVIRLKNKFHELARIDSLTGVLTRGFLIDYANKELQRAKRKRSGMAILLIDIDEFKEINDSYGHAFGDTYLVAVVGACQKMLRDTDLMGRFGGDEFTIVLDEISAKGMINAAERLLHSVAEISLKAPDGSTVTPSISIGAARSNPNSTLDSLLAEADTALYQAKEEGKGCCCIAPKET